MKKKLKNIKKKCVLFPAPLLSSFFVMGCMSFFLASCDGSPHQNRGLSTLVDRIKSFLGMGEPQPEQNTSETNIIKPETSSSSPAPALNPKEPSTQLPATVSEPVVASSSQPISDEAVKTPTTNESSLPFNERMAMYHAFEEKVLTEEEEKIKNTENDASVKIDAIMKDPRVVVLMQKNPNMTFEELPEDIYGHILKVSEEQESVITTIMEESDKKLNHKAVQLGVYDYINNEDLGGSRDDKRRQPGDLKIKMEGSGVIVEAADESILPPKVGDAAVFGDAKREATSATEHKHEKKDISQEKNQARGKPNKPIIASAPKPETMASDNTNKQAPEKNSFNDDETS